jgi:serine/threonine-protein kinase
MTTTPKDTKNTPTPSASKPEEKHPAPAHPAPHPAPTHPAPAHPAPAHPAPTPKSAPEAKHPETKPEPEYPGIADEQRKRSDEIQAAGVHEWVKAHDERADARQKQVTGVSTPVKEDGSLAS